MANSKETSSKSNREKWIENIKLGGDLIMYIGSAALASSVLRKTRENQNGLMSACAVGTGAMLSIGAGKVASNILNKVVDKTVHFIDDVKPKEKTDEEDTASVVDEDHD